MPIDFTRLYGTTGPAARGAGSVNADMQAVLGLSRGQVVSASVNKVASANALQGQWQRGEMDLPQAKLPPVVDNRSISPGRGVSAQTPDPALQALLSRQALYLVALTVKGHSLITVTDQQLQKGQQVQVQLNSDNRLQLVSPRPAVVEPLMSSSVLGRPTLPLATPETKPPPVNEIKQVLRQLLPDQGRPALISAIKLWQQGLQHLPNVPPVAALRTLVTQLAEQPVTLARTAVSPAATSGDSGVSAPSAAAIQNAIERSGVLLEPRLAAALNRQASGVEIGQLLNTDTKALLLRIIALSTPEVLAGFVRTETASSASSSVAATAPSPTASPESGKLAPSVQTSLPGLLQLLASTPPASNEMRTLQIQLITLLHQQALANLARVRLGQLSPDNPRVRGAEIPGPLPSALSTDLPVRFEGDIHLVKMIIHEEEGNTGSRDQNNSPAGKIWQVKLHLDTANIGEFHVHMKFVDNTLSIDFWSGQAAVLTEARSKFNAIKTSLASAGVDVSQVKYHQGEPIRAGNQLGYSLVDIST